MLLNMRPDLSGNNETNKRRVDAVFATKCGLSPLSCAEQASDLPHLDLAQFCVATVFSARCPGTYFLDVFRGVRPSPEVDFRGVVEVVEDVPPPLSSDDASNVIRGRAVLGRERRSGCSVNNTPTSNLDHVGLGNPGVRNVATARLTLPGDHISGVVGIGAGQQVPRINASAIVAYVAYKKVLGNLADEDGVEESVPGYRPVSDADGNVAGLKVCGIRHLPTPSARLDDSVVDQPLDELGVGKAGWAMKRNRITSHLNSPLYGTNELVTHPIITSQDGACNLHTEEHNA